MGQYELGEQNGDKHPFTDAKKAAQLPVVTGRHVEMLDRPSAGKYRRSTGLDDAEGASRGIAILPGLLR
jgi:hypothetical protein